jgi:two-component system, response regulator RegA
MQNETKKVLIVEDDRDLAECIARSVRSLDPAASIAVTVAEALRLLSEAPAVIICDVRLPDGSGLAVAEAALGMRPIPSIIAISGAASAEEAFALAQRGVRGYLKKPLSLQDLRQNIENLLSSPPILEPMVASLVGRRPIQEVQGEIRRIMVEEALARSGGDRADASRLLEVSRQILHEERPTQG